MAIKISEYTQELTTFDTPETIKQEVSMETSPSVYETKWYSWTTLKNFFTLKNVLLIGNETLGTNIKVNDADAIELENTSTLKKGTYDFGASGGISRICGVGYEDMWQAGIHHVFDSNGLIRESNNCFNIIPDGSFDGTQRFKVGSRWILDDGTVYVCTAIPSAGNAVWEQVLQPYFIDANSNVFLYGTQSSNLGSNCNFNTFSDGNITLGDTCNYNTFEPAMGGPVIFGNNLLNTTVKSGTASANYTASPNYDFMYNLYYPSQIFRNPENDANYHSYYDPTNDRIVLTNLTTLVISYIGGSAGGGDVVGPASATTDNIAVYDGTTGKIIKDGGATIAGINTNAIDLVTVKLSEAISKGQAVYISGANGTNILVSKASNTSEATSSKTIGLLQTSGALNAIVNIVTSGLLDGLDTSTATVGDPVWLGTSGNLIYGLASKPVAPAHLVYIGVVSRVSATVGEIFVRVQNGFELKEIHDVLITSVADKDVLQYESATSLWKNKALTTASVAASTDKNYVTDAQAVVIGNTSGTNSGNETTTTTGALINGATAKTTPISADCIGLMDSAASNILKKVSISDLKTVITDSFTVTSFNGTWATPADSTTYYLPLMGGIVTPLTTITSFLNTFTFAVKIVGICVQHLNAAGTVGSSENVSVGIRNNTDGTNNALINIQTTQANGVIKNFEDYSLNVDIPANKAIATYVSTPAWVTNPTNLGLRITLFIQKV